MGSALLAEDDLVADDGIGVIAAEEYVKFRVQPLMQWCLNESIHLARSTTLVQVLIYIFTLISALCPFFGFKKFIPMAIAAGAALESISQFEHWPTRLSAANASLAQLQGALLMWKSLSRTQRRQTG